MKLREWIPGILALVALAGFSGLSHNFLDGTFLLSKATIYVEAGLLALGMTFVIITGNIDLSVASNMVLTACITGKLFGIGLPMPVAIGSALIMSTSLGALNGVLVSFLKIPSFLVTLATMAAFRGLAQAMLGPTSVTIPESFKGIDQVGVASVPVPILIFLALAVLCGLILSRTVMGRWLVAVGANESASEFSGVPTTKVKIFAFAMTGLLCGVGALLLISRLGVARHDLARGVELEAITTVVVGGTSILGGRGSILGTVLALILVSIIKTGMGVANVAPEIQLTAIGLLLIFATLSMNFSFVSKKTEKNPKMPVAPAVE